MILFGKSFNDAEYVFQRDNLTFVKAHKAVAKAMRPPFDGRESLMRKPDLPSSKCSWFNHDASFDPVAHILYKSGKRNTTMANLLLAYNKP